MVNKRGEGRNAPHKNDPPFKRTPFLDETTLCWPVAALSSDRINIMIRMQMMIPRLPRIRAAAGNDGPINRIPLHEPGSRWAYIVHLARNGNQTAGNRRQPAQLGEKAKRFSASGTGASGTHGASQTPTVAQSGAITASQAPTRPRSDYVHLCHLHATHVTSCRTRAMGQER